MTRILIGIILVLGSLSWFLWWRSDQLSEKLQETQTRLVAHEAAAVVHREHINRLDKLLSGAASFDREIQSMEGADAPLDPRMLPAARRLWP